MEYNSNEIKTIKSDEKYCPYCKSLNLKEYLYGMPRYDYDRDKYVLGGCMVGTRRPTYKCCDCEKDIYIEEEKWLSEMLSSSENVEVSPINNEEFISINWRDDEVKYEIVLTKHSNTVTISLEKIIINSVYKIDDTQPIEKNDYDRYYNRIFNLANDIIDEINNNKLISNKTITEWKIVINDNKNHILLNDKKVPTCIERLKHIILELENLYIFSFEQRRYRMHKELSG